MIEKLLLFMREVHNKKIHSYPKDVLIAAVIFAAAVCQWGGNHGKAAETVSFAALEDIAEKKVAITFDDGPNPDYTEELLEGLKERNVTASFFLLGKEAEKFPDIVKKIHEGGHLIGTHSYEHVNLCNLTDEAAVEQVDKTNQVILELTGE